MNWYGHFPLHPAYYFLQFFALFPSLRFSNFFLKNIFDASLCQWTTEMTEVHALLNFHVSKSALENSSEKRVTSQTGLPLYLHRCSKSRMLPRRPPPSQNPPGVFAGPCKSSAKSYFGCYAPFVTSQRAHYLFQASDLWVGVESKRQRTLTWFCPLSTMWNILGDNFVEGCKHRAKYVAFCRVFSVWFLVISSTFHWSQGGKI